MVGSASSVTRKADDALLAPAPGNTPSPKVGDKRAISAAAARCRSNDAVSRMALGLFLPVAGEPERRGVTAAEVGMDDKEEEEEESKEAEEIGRRAARDGGDSSELKLG